MMCMYRCRYRYPIRLTSRYATHIFPIGKGFFSSTKFVNVWNVFITRFRLALIKHEDTNINLAVSPIWTVYTDLHYNIKSEI